VEKYIYSRDSSQLCCYLQHKIYFATW